MGLVKFFTRKDHGTKELEKLLKKIDKMSILDYIDLYNECNKNNNEVKVMNNDDYLNKLKNDLDEKERIFILYCEMYNKLSDKDKKKMEHEKDNAEMEYHKAYDEFHDYDTTLYSISESGEFKIEDKEKKCNCAPKQDRFAGDDIEEEYARVHPKDSIYMKKPKIFEWDIKQEFNNPDNVNHPSHYTFGKIEVIDVIEDWKLGYHEGNIIKYVARHKYKNGLEDLKKAKWYLERLIEEMESIYKNS